MIKLSLTEWINILFGVVMVIVYAGVGVLLLFVNMFFPNVPTVYKNILGVVTIIYAAYRIYRLYTFYNQIKINSQGTDDEDL